MRRGDGSVEEPVPSDRQLDPAVVYNGEGTDLINFHGSQLD